MYGIDSHNFRSLGISILMRMAAEYDSPLLMNSIHADAIRENLINRHWEIFRERNAPHHPIERSAVDAAIERHGVVLNSSRIRNEDDPEMNIVIPLPHGPRVSNMEMNPPPARRARLLEPALTETSAGEQQSVAGNSEATPQSACDPPFNKNNETLETVQPDTTAESQNFSDNINENNGDDKHLSNVDNQSTNVIDNEAVLLAEEQLTNNNSDNIDGANNLQSGQMLIHEERLHNINDDNIQDIDNMANEEALLVEVSTQEIFKFLGLHRN